MKTNHLLIATLLLLITASCSTNYRMTSRVATNGSIDREVYARADSAFMAGDRSHNPFLFQIDADWQVTYLDSALSFDFWGEKEMLNVKVSRTIPTVDGQYFAAAQGKEHMSSLAIPTERVKKSFRWFYTYYIYSASYSELPDKGPVPLISYMTEEEQTIWFCGNNNQAYHGMNGMEQKDYLDKLETKFAQWMGRSQYEINWQVVRSFTLAQGDPTHLHRLDEAKETIYHRHFATQDTWGDVSMDTLCLLLDSTCQTSYYSQLYKKNEKAMTTMGEEKSKMVEVLYHAIQFELTMPGRLHSSNAGTVNKHTAIWKVDGFRLLAGNYVLTAESRVTNYWAFGLTLLCLLLMLGAFVKRYRS